MSRWRKCVQRQRLGPLRQGRRGKGGGQSARRPGSTRAHARPDAQATRLDSRRTSNSVKPTGMLGGISAKTCATWPCTAHARQRWAQEGQGGRARWRPASMHARARAHAGAQMHSYAYIHAHTTHTHTRAQTTHTRARTHTSTYTHAHMRTYKHKHVPVCVSVHTGTRANALRAPAAASAAFRTAGKPCGS